MVPEQIERETIIAAPVERVWALLTEAEHLGRWFGDAGAELDLRPGGALRPAAGPSTAPSAGAWSTVERPRRFGYRWAVLRDRRQRAGRAATRRWSSSRCSAEGDGTRLRVVESGFDSSSPTRPSSDDDARTTARAGPASSTSCASTPSASPSDPMSAAADEVMAALADPTRWRVLNLLAERGEGTATTLAGELPVSRVAVVKHLAVLDRAGLVEGAAPGPRGRATACGPSAWRKRRAGWPASPRSGTSALRRSQAPGRGRRPAGR